MMTLKKFDDKYRLDTEKDILGIDEAGRGPLAGPMIVAGVILPSDYNDERITDSKKLTEEQREILFDEIKVNAKEIMVETVTPKKIDAGNLHKLVQRKNKKIAEAYPDAFVITDYVDLGEEIDHDKLVKADSKSLSVAAASIVAKVTRDRIMKAYGKQYPEYAFEFNKGYGTKKHMEALKEHGVLPIHRKSFKPVAEEIDRKKFE